MKIIEKRKSVRKDKRAVSPVIGVILMVAITVIMAAIVMSHYSSIAVPEVSKKCGLSVSRINDTHIRVTVTSIHPSGADITNITCTDVQILSSPIVGSYNNTVSLNKNEYAVMVCNWADGARDVIYDAKI
jgi:flagellin-like protein